MFKVMTFPKDMVGAILLFVDISGAIYVVMFGLTFSSFTFALRCCHLKNNLWQGETFPLTVPFFSKDMKTAQEKKLPYSFDNYILICKVYQLEDEKSKTTNWIFSKPEEEILNQVNWFFPHFVHPGKKKSTFFFGKKISLRLKSGLFNLKVIIMKVGFQKISDYRIGIAWN